MLSQFLWNFGIESSMRFETKKQKNGGIEEELPSVQISFYSFRFQHAVYFWGGIREPRRKKGGLFSELAVTSLRKPMRFETKKRKNGGAGGGTLPQRGAASGGVRRRDAAALHSGR